MAYTNTGYRRSLKISVTKHEVNEYEGDTTIELNGLNEFTVSGTTYPEWTDETLRNTSLTNFNTRLNAFKSYIYQTYKESNPGLFESIDATDARYLVSISGLTEKIVYLNVTKHGQDSLIIYPYIQLTTDEMMENDLTVSFTYRYSQDDGASFELKVSQVTIYSGETISEQVILYYDNVSFEPGEWKDSIVIPQFNVPTIPTNKYVIEKIGNLN